MPNHPRLPLAKDREDIILKFRELIEKAERGCQNLKERGDGKISSDLYFNVRTSALNLLARITNDDSFYVRELRDMDGIDPSAIKGILEAALVDYTQGFMADHKLLVSAEVFADFLVQSEILLENDYKDAAAVIVRAVLEDGLRRRSHARGLSPNPKDGIDDLAKELVKHNIITALQKKEIDAKRELGNSAAHGRFGDYTKADVVGFLEFVQRFLANLVG